MKVWIVEQCFSYEGCELWGVFSTQEKAEAFKAKAIAANRGGSWVVYERELDNEQDLT